MARRTSSGKRPQAASAPAKTAEAKAAPSEPHGPLAVIREWADALVIAFVLAMFIRVFLVELFKIPTGSMTPTLIGGVIADVDYDQDGRKDMLFWRDGGAPLLFRNNGKRLVGEGPIDALPPVHRYERYDRILVNKLSYWFGQPRRGDIVVFKVPPVIWAPDKPIYIKRVTGEPGDRISFDNEGHLVANGQRVLKPDFFETQRYDPSPYGLVPDPTRNPEIQYGETAEGAPAIQSIQVPPEEIFVFGDNTHSSLDSRYWGGVALANVKGRAFFRYWPPSQMRFLHGG